jgi:hypothetical protein
VGFLGDDLKLLKLRFRKFIKITKYGFGRKF